MMPGEYLERLKIIKQVRETASASDKLAIPTLVVVGSQSVGKSTVMTACTDLEFPQGDGICTKAATVVSCSYSSKQQATFEIEVDGEWKEIKKDQVANEIRQAQAQLLQKEGKAADATWICKEEIRLRVSGPDAMDIILVDLPGIIENAPDNVSEAELEHLKQQIDQLICSYIKRPETLIAVVQRADEDIERVSAIRTAKKHDADGKRTFKIMNMFEEDCFTSHGTRDRAVQLVNDQVDSQYGPHALTRKTKDGRVKTKEEERAELMKLGVADLRAGVASLKPRLMAMFERLIDDNLPALVHTVRVAVEESRESLRHIGTGEATPLQLVQQVVRSLEDAKSDLTQQMTAHQVIPFKEAIHKTRENVSLEFVSEGYCHNASLPGELQLQEQFEKALIQVTDLWKPMLETYLGGLPDICEQWMQRVLLNHTTSQSLRAALLSEFSNVMHKAGRVLKDACFQALDAELKFSSINDHYLNSKKERYDILPKKLEDDIRSMLTQKLNSRGQAADRAFVEDFMQGVCSLRKKIEASRCDMIERNKQEIHSLVMANFDVAKKTFLDTVWKHTLQMVGPCQRRHWSAQQFDSMFDWIKYGIISESKILESAVEDVGVKEKRDRLKAKVDRLERCQKLLQSLAVSSTCPTSLVPASKRQRID